MLLFSKSFLIVLLFFGSVTINLSGQQQSNYNYYQKGKQAAEGGDFKRALQIWLTAKGELEVPQTRIGVAFIKLVTKEGLEKYNQFATLMYKWGLSATQLQPNKKALQEIIERLKVIADSDIYRRWDDLIKNDNPKIYQELLSFWKARDLTPATGFNERLIEHWQRIAYSQKHFNRDNNGLFNADDRAKIYVRYGKPHHSSGGNLQFDKRIAISALSSSGVLGPSSGGIPRIVRVARMYHRSPEYIVWVYYPNQQREEKLIYIFGGAGGTSGMFRMIESIGAFIPSGAYRSLTRAAVGDHTQISQLTPATILQIMYYRQLSNVESYFANRYLDIISIAKYPEKYSYMFAERKAHKAKLKLQNAKIRAPQQTSTIAGKMIDIPVQIYTYRLLNDQNKPVLAAFVESKPQDAFWIDYLHNYGAKDTFSKEDKKKQLSSYLYSHIVQLYNEDGELISRAKVSPLIAVTEHDISSSVFTIPFIGEDIKMVFTAKLQNKDSSSEYKIAHLPFPQSLRGIGTARLEQIDYLKSIEGKLQMADLIIGYNYRKSEALNSKFPFTVANDHTIPKGETLVVHIEVYHLTQNAEGFGKLSLSYQIKPEEGLLGFLDKDQQPLRLTFNLETLKPRYVENLRIKTRELPPGEYTLMIKAKDKQTRQEVKRLFNLEIIESLSGHE